MTLNDQTQSPLPTLAPRRPNSHKGDYGRALLIGGSRGMCGAIAMAGLAALRSGAGLVTLAVPRSVQDVVAGLGVCFMTHGLSDVDGEFDSAAAREAVDFGIPASVLALGPGLGRGDRLTPLVERLYLEVKRPMVVDADALFALSQTKDVLKKPGGLRVLTPHPVEFARIVGGDVPLGAQRITSAAELARRDVSRNTIVVLKGHETVVTDGKHFCLNHTGNPGMATGGSGDVLTGIITALLCQGLSPFDAARLGVHVHGLAGDLAAAELGEVSLIASDLIDFLPKAFRKL
jgi:ADP-dependent NAD(P)H-hydrate dehydratase